MSVLNFSSLPFGFECSFYILDLPLSFSTSIFAFYRSSKQRFSYVQLYCPHPIMLIKHLISFTILTFEFYGFVCYLENVCSLVWCFRMRTVTALITVRSSRLQSSLLLTEACFIRFHFMKVNSKFWGFIVNSFCPDYIQILV